MRIALVALALCAAMRGQPSQLERQTAILAEVGRLQAQAKAAYEREMAREKAAEAGVTCPSANDTGAIIRCLAGEISTTRANFREFAGAIRSILSLKGADAKDTVLGPTGQTSSREEDLKAFDDAASAWEKFSNAQCDATYRFYRGGSMGSIQTATCELLLLGSRMRDMNYLYAGLLLH